MRKYLYYALLLLMLLLGAAKAFVDYQLETLAQQAVQQAPPDTHVSYQQVRLALPSQVVADAVQIQAPDFPAVQIQQLHLHKIYRFIQAQLQQQALPENWQVSAQQAQVSLKFLQMLPDTQTLWQMLGYQNYYLSPSELQSLLGQHLNADVDVQVQWQQKQGQLVAQVSVHSEKLGNIQLQIEAQGIRQRINWQQVQIQELHVSWQPGRWLSRLSQYLGQKQKLDAASVRQQLAQKLVQDGQKTGVLDPQAQQAVKNFVQDLQPLKLSLKPAKPFFLQELLVLSPNQWKKRLGVNWQ